MEKNFHIEKMSGGHFALFFGRYGDHRDIMLVSDSACESTAEAIFEDFIQEHCSKQWQMTILAAVEEGFEYDRKFDPETNLVDAENYLIKNVEPKFEYCKLYNHGYSYKNHVVSGEIFDFGHYKAEKGVYYNAGGDTFEPVDWFEVPSHGEEGRESYIFVFDIIVYDGEVLKLYDHFE